MAGNFDEVLDETPPDSVRVKRGETGAHRSRLCRIAPEDHDRLAAAKAAYLEALRSAPNKLPRLESDAEAALPSACSAPVPRRPDTGNRPTCPARVLPALSAPCAGTREG